MRAMRGEILALALATGACLAAPARAAEPDTAPPTAPPSSEPAVRDLRHKLIYYLPNRLIDAIDPLRARLRIGPGFGFGFRATRPLSFYLGGHAAFYLGLHGPREAPIPPLPYGTEADGSRAASTASRRKPAIATVPPGYTASELGIGFQLAIAGLDLGFDPLEVADFVGGIVGIDFRGDDL